MKKESQILEIGSIIAILIFTFGIIIAVLIYSISWGIYEFSEFLKR